MESKIKRFFQGTLSEEMKQRIKEQWDKEKRYYFSKAEKAQSLNENVMLRYYGIRHNDYRPVLLKETTLDRILAKYGAKGLVIISANRNELPQEIEDINTQRLISDIKRSGYSYLPIYCRFRNKNIGVLDDFEPSFIVFNHTENGDECDFEKLRNFAQSMCGKHNQHSVMMRYPNSKKFTYGISDTLNNDSEGLVGCYVNPLPTSLSEEQRRSGEIMVWRVRGCGSFLSTLPQTGNVVIFCRKQIRYKK